MRSSTVLIAKMSRNNFLATFANIAAVGGMELASRKPPFVQERSFANEGRLLGSALGSSEVSNVGGSGLTAFGEFVCRVALAKLLSPMPYCSC